MKNKRILYINQYFKHPDEPGITRSYWIAKELISRGYEVTMLAHRNTMLDHVSKAPKKEKTNVDGIQVIYIRNEYSNEMGMIERAISFLKFMVGSTYEAYKMKDIDLVIATSTPLTVAFPALIRKWLKKTPFVFEVRDLWPEVPIQMGAIKSKVIINFLKWFERKTYKNAVHVVALSPGMQGGVAKYVERSKTSMIPNMAKMDRFFPRPFNYDLVKRMGLAHDSFKLIYFGQMGLSNDIEYVLDVARICKKQEMDDVEFIFVGHGLKYKKVQAAILEEGLSNVFIFGRRPMDEISDILNFCDVSLVMFTDIPILYTNSPNKLFDSLSAAKPIIVNSAGWTKSMVEDNECGYYVNPSDPKELIEKIILLKQEGELKERLGSNSRRLAETTYDKSILCHQFGDMIDGLFQNELKR